MIRTGTPERHADLPVSETSGEASELKSALRVRALDLGIDLCRVTTARPPDSAGHFRTWLDGGLHGELNYLARNAGRRTDPNLVLPGARSIICLGVSYVTDEAPEASAEAVARRLTGTVARYARFADYHEILGARLEALSTWLEERGGAGARTRWYVDTGPVLERDLAQRAGVGFIGKHTNLISRELGNWFFLGEILTTLELEPDAPERNRCGSCTRCLKACPTGALPEPFVLDARRCISYLTIELKGPIPVEWRPLIGTRIFGCDDCLEACPWNRFAKAGRMMRPFSRRDLHLPDLLELLDLDEAAFRARFRGTPLARTKRRGLLRNVCVALGNLRDPAAREALERATRDPDPLISSHAEWGLEQLAAR